MRKVDVGSPGQVIKDSSSPFCSTNRTMSNFLLVFVTWWWQGSCNTTRTYSEGGKKGTGPN